MKKYLKKNNQNVKSLIDFKAFEISAKQQVKLKGGNDYIGVEDLIDG